METLVQRWHCVSSIQKLNIGDGYFLSSLGKCDLRQAHFVAVLI